jgi:hypothetical protein
MYVQLSEEATDNRNNALLWTEQMPSTGLDLACPPQPECSLHSERIITKHPALGRKTTAFRRSVNAEK